MTGTLTKVRPGELITKENAAGAKRRIHVDIQAPLQPPQRWYALNFASVEAALTYLNENPIQSTGEVAATARNDGTVSMLTIFSPTAPLQSPQRWFFQNFSSANNAVTYLNETPAQSDGEVSATLRNDGSVGVFYIAPAQGRRLEHVSQKWDPVL
jgi:hypothetical protein